MAYVLAAGLPGFACPNSVLPRGGLRSRSFVPLRRRKSWDRGLLHAKPSEPSTPPPRTRVGGAEPPGGRRRPSRRLYSVRTPRGWLGPARGEFLAPNSPLGPPPVLLAGFWATGGGRNPLGFVRWVVPIKARGRYTLCSAIHSAEGARRVRKGDFWESELLAKDALTEFLVVCRPLQRLLRSLRCLQVHCGHCSAISPPLATAPASPSPTASLQLQPQPPRQFPKLRQHHRLRPHPQGGVRWCE
jgi:hypothetical protein